MRETMRELVDAIRHYSPRTARTLAGATESEVSALETALGRPLPAVYRELLLTAGHGFGLFRPFEGRYDFSIEVAHAAAVEAPSPRYVFIAEDDAGLGMPLRLDCAAPGDDPPVVAGSGRSVEVKDASLRRFLLTEVFVSLRMPLLVWQARLVATNNDATPLAALDALARELRILPVPHTGAWHPCYDRGDVAIEAHQPPGLGFILTLAAAEETWLEELRPILEQRLDLKSIT